MSGGGGAEPLGLRLTILGCGSSGGVPRLGGPDGTGNWGACDPENPKNRRRRCALLVERIGPGGVTRVLIDAGPDIREQLLSAKVATLDAVLITHDHADHIHGIDDLRLVFFNLRKRVPVWTDERTQAVLEQRFGYIFETPEGSLYPPILERFAIRREPSDGAAGDGDLGGAARPWREITIDGAGGPIPVLPFEVEHGAIPALGFRIGRAAYLPDVSAMTPEAWAAVTDLDLWILDALRYTPHPSHANLETALSWIAQARPKQAVLTNMHVDLDYAAVEAETPDGVTPAFDGMALAV